MSTEKIAIVTRLSDVEPQPIEWTWRNRVPRSKVTLVQGDPGLGKSLITIDMAARISSGRPWPDLPNEPQEPGGVILLSAEDDLADTVRPRLDAAGADPRRIVSLEGTRYIDTETGGTRDHLVDLDVDLESVEQAIDESDPCALIVIDPITAYLGNTKNGNDNSDMRALLARLAVLAARRRVAIVAVSHPRKAPGRAVHSSIGSIAFVAAARAVWGVARDPQDAERRLLFPVKMNLAPDTGCGLAFKVVGGAGGQPILSWSREPVHVDPEALLGERRGQPRGKAQEAAESFLQRALADGPREAGDLKREAEGFGLSESSVDRASRELGVFKAKSGGRGDPWLWSLSPMASDPGTHELTPLTSCGENQRENQRRQQTIVRGPTPLNGDREPGEEP